MKISCQSCAAKYTIADEKVVGKVIKLKCKKCSSTIVVNGNDPAVVAQLQAGDGADDAATQLMGQQHAAYGAEPSNPDEWTVSVTDDDQRTMTTAQILTEYAKGALTHDTYVWKEGMGDWAPLLEVPELAQLLQQASQEATAVAPAPAGFGTNGNGHHAPMAAAPMAAAPMAAAAAPSPVAATPSPGATTAARRAGGRGGGVDLFGGGGLQHEPSAKALPAAPNPADKHIGERNETSVLFSLKDLAAAEASAAKPVAKASDPFAAAKNDRVDDILSLGGVGAAPMLAPPPLMAPVIEAPPPPPPPSVAPAAMSPMVAAAQFAPPQKSSPLPFIIGGVGVLALIGGVIFFVAGGSGDDKSKDTTNKETASDTKPAETSKPAETTMAAADTAKPADTQTPTEEPTATTTASADAPPSDPKTAPTGQVANNDPKKTDPKDPKKDEPKKDEPKKDDPPAAGGGDAPFDRGAASAALSAAAGSAKGCKKADGPTGSTKVQVTFAPSGKATQATVGPPFAGTSVGSCIASAFKSAKVPPFSGAPMTVSKTVNIK
ncbi:MAG: zinc-ribbon domain-containing protein [Myxococcales bacterium]|nr:zinc-ribbon domain-containing protein [Myxococcales bacterium]